MDATSAGEVTPNGPAYAAGRAEPWTFDSLAGAERRTLEQVMLTGAAPDFAQIEGHLYRGWNHEWVATLSGRKFAKGFRRKDGRGFGYNHFVAQDGKGPRGEWRLKAKRGGTPRHVGLYRVVAIAGEPPQRLYAPYRHAGLFDYGVAENTWLDLPFRVIRDVVVLPNPGDHEVMLGKAYLQFGFKFANLFWSYFVLGHRQPIEFEPPWSG